LAAKAGLDGEELGLIEGDNIGLLGGGITTVGYCVEGEIERLLDVEAVFEDSVELVLEIVEDEVLLFMYEAPKGVSCELVDEVLTLEDEELLEELEEQVSGKNGQTPALMQFCAHSVALRSRLGILQSIFPQVQILVQSGVKFSEKPQGAGGAEALGAEIEELEVVELVLLDVELIELVELLLVVLLELELELEEGH
jgi:hypothetical protein